LGACLLEEALGFDVLIQGRYMDALRIDSEESIKVSHECRSPSASEKDYDREHHSSEKPPMPVRV